MPACVAAVERLPGRRVGEPEVGAAVDDHACRRGSCGGDRGRTRRAAARGRRRRGRRASRRRSAPSTRSASGTRCGWCAPSASPALEPAVSAPISTSGCASSRRSSSPPAYPLAPATATVRFVMCMTIQTTAYSTKQGCQGWRDPPRCRGLETQWPRAGAGEGSRALATGTPEAGASGQARWTAPCARRPARRGVARPGLRLGQRAVGRPEAQRERQRLLARPTCRRCRRRTAAPTPAARPAPSRSAVGDRGRGHGRVDDQRDVLLGHRVGRERRRCTIAAGAARSARRGRARPRRCAPARRTPRTPGVQLAGVPDHRAADAGARAAAGVPGRPLAAARPRRRRRATRGHLADGLDRVGPGSGAPAPHQPAASRSPVSTTPRWQRLVRARRRSSSASSSSVGAPVDPEDRRRRPRPAAGRNTDAVSNSARSTDAAADVAGQRSRAGRAAASWCRQRLLLGQRVGDPDRACGARRRRAGRARRSRGAPTNG